MIEGSLGAMEELREQASAEEAAAKSKNVNTNSRNVDNGNSANTSQSMSDVGRGDTAQLKGTNTPSSNELMKGVRFADGSEHPSSPRGSGGMSAQKLATDTPTRPYYDFLYETMSGLSGRKWFAHPKSKASMIVMFKQYLSPPSPIP
jgi:hypothetical protein